MENSLKGLILAAGTIITCVVISLGFFISREAKDTASSGANQINNINAEFLESDKTIYEGAKVSGSEVINVIKRFSGKNIAIKVKTNKSVKCYGNTVDETTGTLTGGGSSIADVYSEDNAAYINPSAVFRGSIIRDANDTITAIAFTQ